MRNYFQRRVELTRGELLALAQTRGLADRRSPMVAIRGRSRWPSRRADLARYVGLIWQRSVRAFCVYRDRVQIGRYVVLRSGTFVEEEVAGVPVLELDSIGEALGYEVRGRSVRRFCFIVCFPDAHRRETPVVKQDQPVAHKAGLLPQDREHPAPRDLSHLLGGASLH